MIKFNEVTWYSKLAAAILFLVIVPFLAFYIGTQYQEAKSLNAIVDPSQGAAPVSAEKSKSKDAREVGILVLTALKNKDYVALANLTSVEGLTVSLDPYNIFEQKSAWTYGDGDSFGATTTAKKDFSKEEVSTIGTSIKEHVFGNTDGKGDPIMGTARYFFDKWVYSHDYLNAPEIGFNKVREGGSSGYTIKEDVGNRDFILYYFPGFDEKVKGFDWSAMYLVFSKESGEYKIRAIVKDNWTI
jgi:hypothetical protein